GLGGKWGRLPHPVIYREGRSMNVLDVKLQQKSRGTIEVARDWLDDFGQVALATVVSTWGSAPVPIGGQLIVAPGSRFEGSVSGGCVEAEVIAEADDIIASDRPKLLEFGIAEETAWSAGLPCGGAIKVYVEPLRRERDGVYLEAVLAARLARTSLVVLTTLRTGARRLFGTEESMPEIAICAHERESRLVETADGQAFLHALVPPVRLVIVGATHIGQVLADIAQRINYDVVIVDPRTAFASQERFGQTETLTEWPELSLRNLKIDARTAVVALTHAAALDDEAMRESLRARCLYIGALGSKRTHAKRVERLRAEGISEKDLARIRAPVGLPIGAKGPAEIAVSIIAEIVKTSRRGP
ncbi:MAG: XdhC family protein, partial [Steroidobacteraceae bacterium]